MLSEHGREHFRFKAAILVKLRWQANEVPILAQRFSVSSRAPGKIEVPTASVFRNVVGGLVGIITYIAKTDARGGCQEMHRSHVGAISNNPDSQNHGCGFMLDFSLAVRGLICISGLLDLFPSSRVQDSFAASTDSLKVA